MNICIHIQTHLPHFKYANKLICSFLELTNIITLKIPIFIIIDNNELINNFKMNYNYDYNLIYFLNIEEIINNFTLEFKEKKKDLFKKNIDIKWGAGGHRNYVAVKRTYSILELERLGYNYVWCLDSESLILKNTNIEEIETPTEVKDEELVSKENLSLRDKLVKFDQEVISKKYPNTDKNEKVLSRYMLFLFLDEKPRNLQEFIEKFSEDDRTGISTDESIYVREICKIIDEHLDL